MKPTKFVSGQELWNLGLIQEANRVFFHPLGLSLCVDLDKGVLKVGDCRENMEGVTFAPGAMDARKYARFLEFYRQRSNVRSMRLGFFKQPAPVVPSTSFVRSIPAKPFNLGPAKNSGLR